MVFMSMSPMPVPRLSSIWGGASFGEGDDMSESGVLVSSVSADALGKENVSREPSATSRLISNDEDRCGTWALRSRPVHSLVKLALCRLTDSRFDASIAWSGRLLERHPNLSENDGSSLAYIRPDIGLIYGV